MSTVISAAELRAVLGVSSSLYSDAILTDICDTAEQIIGPMLVQWNAPIDQHKSPSATKTWFHTTIPHKFYVGQTIVITGVQSHTGSKQVATVEDAYTFTITTIGATVHDWRYDIPAGLAAANDLSQYNDVSAVESAMLVVAVDIFQARIAPGGSVQGLDFTPGPYKMGRSILNRVIGLLGPYLDVESVVG